MQIKQERNRKFNWEWWISLTSSRLSTSLLSEVWQRTFDKLNSEKMLNHWWVQFYDHRSDEKIVYSIELNQKHLETCDILKTAWL